MSFAEESVSAIAADPDGLLRPRLGKLIKGRIRQARTLTGVRKHLAKTKPQLLVADVKLEGCVELVMTERVNHPEMNVLLVTNAPATERVASLLEYGTVDLLRSPFLDAELKLRLRTLAAANPPLYLKHDSSSLLSRLHDRDTGRIDAKKVAEAYDLSLRALAKALGRSPQSVSKTPAGPALQEHLGHFRRSYELLLRLLGDEARVKAWLNTPQQDLGGERPIALFRKGEAEAVRSFLEVMYAGGPS